MPPSAAHAFPKPHRLLRPAEFARVFARRRSAADDILIVHACENELDHPRLGLAVSRRVGGAVVRNRWKRVIREAFRTRRSELPQSMDLVVIPRSGTAPKMQQVAVSLIRLAGRLERKLKG